MNIKEVIEIFPLYTVETKDGNLETAIQINHCVSAIKTYSNAMVRKQMDIDNLLDLQSDLRELLFCRPLDIDSIETKSILLCDAIVYASENSLTK